MSIITKLQEKIEKYCQENPSKDINHYLTLLNKFIESINKFEGIPEDLDTNDNSFFETFLADYSGNSLEDSSHTVIHMLNVFEHATNKNSGMKYINLNGEITVFIIGKDNRFIVNVDSYIDTINNLPYFTDNGVAYFIAMYALSQYIDSEDEVIWNDHQTIVPGANVMNRLTEELGYDSTNEIIFNALMENAILADALPDSLVFVDINDNIISRLIMKPTDKNSLPTLFRDCENIPISAYELFENLNVNELVSKYYDRPKKHTELQFVESTKELKIIVS